MHYLGIEIGGTKLQLGLGPGDGTLAALWRGPVDPAAGGDGIRKQITAAVPELLARGGVERPALRGVGIGFGGPVDDARHTVIKSHQIAGWDNFPLADWVGDLLGLPAALGNDADVAGLAEALFGAGKGLSPVFYITIGSGIGGGLIINGEIYRGCGRGAAEIGHVKVSPRHWLWPEGAVAEDGPVRPEAGTSWADAVLRASQSGMFFCPLEEVTSGWSIGRVGQAAVRLCVNPDSILVRQFKEKPDQVTAADVAEASSKGDALAGYILRQAGECLAEAVGHMIVLLCPRRIVIGGGVSLMGEKLLFEPLRRMVAERVFKPFANCYDIVPATLGEEVVVHGALALARRRLPE